LVSSSSESLLASASKSAPPDQARGQRFDLLARGGFGMLVVDAREDVARVEFGDGRAFAGGVALLDQLHQAGSRSGRGSGR
jgi:hypothetical protein